ncbi:hypothetical protein D3C87_1813320 [compost metagenome]
MFALTIVHPQTFTAPQRTVFTHSDSVECEGNHITAVQRPTVFRQTCRGVSMVMEHRFFRQRQRIGPLSRTVARMGITHHAFR